MRLNVCWPKCFIKNKTLRRKICFLLREQFFLVYPFSDWNIFQFSQTSTGAYYWVHILKYRDMFSISLGKLPLESSIKRGFKTPFVCLFFSTCRFIWNEEDNPESTWYVSSSCRFMRLGEGGGGGRVIVLVLVLIRALSHVCRKYHALNKMSNNTRIWKLFG